MLALRWSVAAQDLPPCAERPTIADLPRVEPLLWCIERPVSERGFGELAFTAIEFAPDGTLYATRPLTGELFALYDSNNDGLPDEPQLAADGLILPNGLVYAENALYILGDGHIYRYEDGVVQTIVDDLPGGQGFMASGITYHDGWLYIGVPMPCDFCEPTQELQGTVVRMRLDGSAQHVVARGLRYPAGLAVWQDVLWVTDSGRDGLRALEALDELNRISLDRDDVPHFGFPYCIGMDNRADMPGEFDCSSATAPYIALMTHSVPRALQPYHSDTFRFMGDAMLLVLSGSTNNESIRGYEVTYFKAQETAYLFETVLPVDIAVSGSADQQNVQSGGAYGSGLVYRLNGRGAGLWPHRIYDVAVSPEGWIYISSGSGQIHALRPGDLATCDYRACD